MSPALLKFVLAHFIMPMVKGTGTGGIKASGMGSQVGWVKAQRCPPLYV